MTHIGRIVLGLLLLTTFLILTLLGATSTTPTTKAATPPNVILVTLDGVRWQEMFHGTDPALSGGAPSTPIFEKLRGRLAQRGFLIGDRDAGSRMEVANPVRISLPAYQSILTGMTQPCESNSCGAVRVETMPEHIMSELGLNGLQAATIASWDEIRHAAKQESGGPNTFVNVAFEDLKDGGSDTELMLLNLKQSKDRPAWGHARGDQYTYAQAKRFITRNHRRFLFVSLNDSDEWAHRGDYPNYVKTLKQYDAWVADLVDTLDRLGDYGKATTLIVTTDHGRGDGREWTDHGVRTDGSEHVWLYATGPGVQDGAPNSDRVYTHLDIRPTVEASLGLEPNLCANCGRPLP